MQTVRVIVQEIECMICNVTLQPLCKFVIAKLFSIVFNLRGFSIYLPVVRGDALAPLLNLVCGYYKERKIDLVLITVYLYKLS